jgi:hypothetical protein
MKLHGAEFGKVRLKSDLIMAIVVKTAPDGTPTEDDPEVVPARLIWVPEHIEDLCEAGAILYLQDMLRQDPGDEQVQKQKQLLMLSWALRKDLPGLKEQVYPFPVGALEDGTWLRNRDMRFTAMKEAAIRKQCPNAGTLWRMYQAFRDAEFPSVVSEKDFMELYEAGKKQSLQTLACKDDSWKLRLALPGLVAGYQRFERSNGGGG